MEEVLEWDALEEAIDERVQHSVQFVPKGRLHFLQQLLRVAVDEEVQRRL